MQSYNLSTVCANNLTENTLFTPSLLIEVNDCDIMTSFCNAAETHFGRLSPPKVPNRSPQKPPIIALKSQRTAQNSDQKIKKAQLNLSFCSI